MKNPEIKSSEITPENVYLNRRNFIRAGLVAGTTFATGLTYRVFNQQPPKEVVVKEIKDVKRAAATEEVPNTFEQITTYNNYYEFSTSKTNVGRAAEDFVTRPWTVEVGGLAGKPKVFDIDDLLRFEQEERIYRFRCVEGWSMVIPWVGFPLKRLLDAVEPLGSAKFVAFETFYEGAGKGNPNVKLPQGRNGMQASFLAGIDFPYVEGLRLDEAMHDLTILATGLYGKQLPNQNGAPIRLVVPWKYGFKSIKSVVKITIVDREPPTTWNKAAEDEYGFYSNVNPSVAHPRWSQATERRIGELGSRPTLMFNGYGEQVAKMYEGMNLKKHF
ncbi:MAG: protein-methionine-sulfoxide reductase catalytic subunit MsrP [Acidobacteria bacterium]|nr:protein-methionine-sulfoxide reductase catalytic subunit MsrP [Acidobacteriota bacterium]